MIAFILGVAVGGAAAVALLALWLAVVLAQLGKDDDL